MRTCDGDAAGAGTGRGGMGAVGTEMGMRLNRYDRGGWGSEWWGGIGLSWAGVFWSGVDCVLLDYVFAEGRGVVNGA